MVFTIVKSIKFTIAKKIKFTFRKYDMKMAIWHLRLNSVVKGHIYVPLGTKVFGKEVRGHRTN